MARRVYNCGEYSTVIPRIIFSKVCLYKLNVPSNIL